MGVAITKGGRVERERRETGTGWFQWEPFGNSNYKSGKGRKGGGGDRDRVVSVGALRE